MSESKPAVTTLISALTPLVIGGLGLYFTHTYKESEKRANDINEQRLAGERVQRIEIDKANVIKGYFEYLADTSDENQQRAALVVLGTLGYTDLVIKVVTAEPTPGNVQALAAIAATTTDSDSANRIIGALESISRSTSAEGAATAAEVALVTAQVNQTPSGEAAVVVAGADKSLAAAQFEVDTLRKRGFNDARIVKRGDWYRTVVPVKPEANAAETLQGIQTKIRPNAYIVDQRKWCAGDSAATECQPARP